MKGQQFFLIAHATKRPSPGCQARWQRDGYYVSIVGYHRPGIELSFMLNIDNNCAYLK